MRVFLRGTVQADVDAILPRPTRRDASGKFPMTKTLEQAADAL
jgi:hypothetical protein